MKILLRLIAVVSVGSLISAAVIVAVILSAPAETATSEPTYKLLCIMDDEDLIYRGLKWRDVGFTNYATTVYKYGVKFSASVQCRLEPEIDK